jgi:UDPglucose--hexose-1-phosphate uridylyltransferase
MARVPHHPLIARHFTSPPEWRMNPVTGEWVIIAPERAARPMLNDSPRESSTPTDEPCPFCGGNEELTPGELFAVREPGTAPNGPGWRVRVVPNRFAAVRSEVVPELNGDGFFQRTAGVGRHDLFVECPEHETNLARLSAAQFRDVIHAWRERVRSASHDPGLKYAQLFKNHGPDAGASVAHAHSQLIATPLVPVTVRDELSFARAFHEERGECVYCDLLRRERADGARLIFATERFAVISAFAARQPFETWIIPAAHHSQFELINDAEADDLATVLQSVLRNLESVMEGPSYNLVFHTAPFHGAPLPFYHWHIEVLPRLTQLAGYEWGTGSHVNPILPEDAAAVLRETC